MKRRCEFYPQKSDVHLTYNIATMQTKLHSREGCDFFCTQTSTTGAIMKNSATRGVNMDASKYVGTVVKYVWKDETKRGKGDFQWMLRQIKPLKK